MEERRRERRRENYNTQAAVTSWEVRPPIPLSQPESCQDCNPTLSGVSGSCSVGNSNEVASIVSQEKVKL